MFRILSLYRRLSGAWRPLIIAALLLLSIRNASAQNTGPTDGSTPLGMAPGASAGSYSLSGFDNINFSNGKLSFGMPLVQVGGEAPRAIR